MLPAPRVVPLMMMMAMCLCLVPVAQVPTWVSAAPTTGSNRHTKRSDLDAVNYIHKLLIAGNVQEAVRECQIAVQEHPDSARLAVTLADTYATAGNYTAALSAYAHAHDMTKDSPQEQSKTLTWMGVCHRRLGNTEEAFHDLKMAVENENTQPQRENYYHLSISYQMDFQYVAATRWWARVLQHSSPVKAQDIRQLADLLRVLQHWSLLVSALQFCLRACPDLDQYPEYRLHLELAGAMERAAAMERMALGLEDGVNSGEAQEHFRRAADLSGKSAVALQAQYQTLEAQATGTRQHQAKDLPSNLSQLQEVFMELSSLLDPIFGNAKPLPAWRRIQDQHLERFQWPIAPALSQQARDDMTRQQKDLLSEDDTIAHTDQINDDVVNPFVCLTLPVYTLQDCVFAARASAARIRTRLARPLQTYEQGFDRSQYPDTGELHVGVFSTDIRPHPMLALVYAFCKYTHALPNIRVTLYHLMSDAVTLEHFVDHVDATVECVKERYWECIDHARANRVQVWLETTGATGEGMFGVIGATGPAPVGALWAGFPGSMGMPETLQYMVADEYTVPPKSDIARAYPERMLYVPGSWMIAEPSVVHKVELETKNQTTRTELRAKFDIPTNATVYSYFGRLWKIDDKIFQTWARIIQKVPNAYLVMLHYSAEQGTSDELRNNVFKMWQNHQVPQERLKLLPVFRRGEHILAMKDLSDVALDTSMYSGGTTSYEALYAGLPMVHHSDGDKFMQRAGGSILRAAGLGELLIAESYDDYVAIAARLGTDQAFYDMVTEQLRQARSGANKEAVLFQPHVAVEAMVRGLDEAYRRWKKGGPPHDIYTYQQDSVQNSHGDAGVNSNDGAGDEL